MKKIINLIFIVLLGTLVFNSCVDNEFDEPDFPFVDPNITGNVSLKQFKEKFGKLDSPIKIEDTLVFSAIVIANDSLGNFYKKIIVQDETGGIEILIDGRNLYGLFPIGRKIFVNAKGMVIGKDHGTIQLGGLLSEGELVSLPFKDIDTYIKRGSLFNKIEPKEKSFENFNKDDISTLVKFSNMQFSKEVLGLTFADDTAKSDKNRAINNCSCNSFVIRTSGYSEFAKEELPGGNGDVVCVLGVYSYNDEALTKNDFQGFIRSMEDINFDNERCSGDYTSFDDWETNMLSFGWSMKIVEGEAKWEFNSYKGRKYVQISNYIDGQKAVSDAWLISGKIDLSNMESPKLNFSNASNYSGPDLEVYVSSIYDGESFPNISEWKRFNVKNLSQGDYNWVNSGCISLEDYIGQNVYIGFRYIGNEDEGKTWEIDDVCISDGECLKEPDKFNKDFEDGSLYSGGWESKVLIGNTVWTVETRSGETYGKISNYKNGAKSESDVLFISPKVNLGPFEKPALSFRNASNYPGPDLEVYISNNYNGGLTDISDWTRLNANLSSGSWGWVESGDISLEDYKGQDINIAFRYQGTNSEGSTWEIDDIVLKEYEGGGTGGDETLITIKSIRDKFANGETIMDDKVKIKGIVISDKNNGNLPGKNMVIQDETAGIAIRFDGNHEFNLNDEVEIVVSNLEASEYKNLLQFNNVSLDAVKVIGTGSISPRESTVQELLDNAEEWESTLVYIKEATISGGNVYKDFNVIISDATGSVDFHTSSYASFAESALPSGTIKIKAVVGQYNDKYQVYIRNLDDVEGGTIEPPTGLFADDFEGGNLDKWTIYSVNGDQQWEYSAQYGNPNSCAKMSGYANSSKNANEDWLITSNIDLTGNSSATLNFDNATKYDGPAMQVFISTDYSGAEDPNSANWTEVTYTKSDGSWNWTAASVDLSSYADQKIYVGFKYTSTDSETATWEIDNVVIK